MKVEDYVFGIPVPSWGSIEPTHTGAARFRIFGTAFITLLRARGEAAQRFLSPQEHVRAGHAGRTRDGRFLYGPGVATRMPVLP